MKRWWLLDNFNLWLFIISGLLEIIVVRPGLAEDKKTKLIAGNKEEFESLFLQDKDIRIPQEEQIVTIERVQLNKTKTGFEILLLTPTNTAQQLRVVNVSQENNFIAQRSMTSLSI